MLSKRGGLRPGAGRPAKQPGMKRRRLSTTISQTSWEALRHYAEVAGLTLSEALDRMIAAAQAHPTIAERVVPEADGTGVAPTGRNG